MLADTGGNYFLIHARPRRVKGPSSYTTRRAYVYYYVRARLSCKAAYSAARVSLVWAVAASLRVDPARVVQPNRGNGGRFGARGVG